MKEKNLLRFIIGIILIVLIVIQFNTQILNLTAHEIIGLFSIIVLIIYLILNNKRDKNSIKSKINFIVNILIFLCFLCIAISGIGISRSFFGSTDFGNRFTMQSVHTISAYISLIFIGIHVGLNWANITNAFTSLFHIKEQTKMPVYISTSIAILIFAFGIYSIISANYFHRITSFNRGAVNMQQRWMNRQNSSGSENQNNNQNNNQNAPNDNSNSSGNSSNALGNNSNTQNNDSNAPANNSDTQSNGTASGLSQKSSNQNSNTSGKNGWMNGNQNGTGSRNGRRSRFNQGQGNSRNNMSGNNNNSSINGNNARNGRNGFRNSRISGSKVNIFNIFGIIGLFGVISYYIGKLLSRKKTVSDTLQIENNNIE